MSASVQKDPSGVPIGFSGITRDITERRQIEETARRSDERTRNILENLEDGYWEVDLQGRFTFFNDAMCRISQVSREELLGVNPSIGATPEGAKKMYKTFEKVYRTGVPLHLADYEITRGDGTKGTFEMSASLMRDKEGNPIGFRGITRDATRRKEIENLLRQSEERYRTIIEQMEDGYFEVDMSGCFTFVNDAECRNLGYSREELIGMDRSLYVDETHSQQLAHMFTEVYRTGIPVRAHDLEIIRKGGRTAYNEISVSLMRDSEGRPSGFRGIARDVI